MKSIIVCLRRHTTVLLFIALSSCTTVSKKGVLSPTDNGEIVIRMPSHLRPLEWRWRYSDGKREWEIPAIALGAGKDSDGRWVVNSFHEKVILGRYLVHQSAFKELEAGLNDRPPGKEPTEKTAQKVLERLAAAADKNNDFFVCSGDRQPKEVLKQW